MKKTTNSIFKAIGASNHTTGDRQNEDYYATDPKAIELLLQEEKFNKNIWECAVGEGHLAEVLKKHGYNVKCTDLIYRGYGEGGIDFLKESEIFQGDIITNPPYKFAQQFVEKSLELIPTGNKVAMFLRLLFLEGKSRKKLFLKHPPKVIYVLSSRLKCAKNGDFDSFDSSAVAYAWFVWEKGYSGNTTVKWIN